MTKIRSASKETLKDIAWNTACAVPNHDPSVERWDPCGAWIRYADFENHNSDYGWDIDHVFPVAKLRYHKVPRMLWNHALNIRAMHWKNNLSKSNAYPYYTATVEHCDNINVIIAKGYNIEEALQYQLRTLFKIQD